MIKGLTKLFWSIAFFDFIFIFLVVFYRQFGTEFQANMIGLFFWWTQFILFIYLLLICWGMTYNGDEDS